MHFCCQYRFLTVYFIVLSGFSANFSGQKVELVTMDYSKSFRYLKQNEINKLEERLCHNVIHNKIGPGSDYLSWVDLLTVMIRKSLPGL